MNLERYRTELKTLQEANNFRFLKDGDQQGINFQIHKKDYLNLSSNDYLGIAGNAHLKEVFFINYAQSCNLGAASSRLLTGNHHAYRLLEHDLSNAYGGRSALVFNSGYHANVGILPALASKNDLILADKLVHASTIDGLQLCDAKVMRYRHLGYDHLTSLLEKNRSQYDRVFIVSESVYSMDGDLADLKQLVEIKKRFDAFLYLDEAHSVGVYGKTGLGLCEQEDVINDVDLLVGTFGKAFGSVGAFVICHKVLADYLVNKMRTLIFTTALPEINVAWTLFVFERIKKMEKERMHLQNLSTQLRDGIKLLGFETMGGSQIVPMIAGENELALRWSEQLAEKGFWAMPVRYPTVPKGSARIRFSLSSAMSEDHIENLINTLARTCK